MREGAEPLLPELYAGEGFDAEQASCRAVPTRSLLLQAKRPIPFAILVTYCAEPL